MNTKRSFTSRLGLCLLLCSALLSACGGGSSGGSAASTPPPPPAPPPEPVITVPPVAAGTIRMHLHRVQNDAAQWGVYSWEGPQKPSATWITDRFIFASTDSFGGYVDIPLDPTKTAVKFVVSDASGNKNCGADQQADLSADVATKGQEAWMLEGDCSVYAKLPAVSFGNLNTASAHWLSATTLAWPGAPTTGSYKLYYAMNGGLAASVDAVTGLTGADGGFTLTPQALPDATKQTYPHLASATGLHLADADAARLPTIAIAQFAIAQYDAAGKLVQVTSLQQAGMLDAVFGAKASQAQLGVSFDNAGVPTFRVWAPTAKSVQLNVYADPSTSSASTLAMTRDSTSGVWRYTAPDANWTNHAYYTYTVQVLSRWANNALVTNTVTDPYSVSTSANSARSFVANLDSAELKPAGWDSQTVPALAAPTDIALYELHIRDFSAADASVPTAHRGKYLAFADTTAAPMRHLKSLQQSGMTHVHLLPAFDYASVNEAGCVNPSIADGAPDANTQQAAAASAKDTDCFNWGYDPVHYNVPEGSYASDANDGAVRVREFRQMVQSLHTAGLRVTMDVVLNHTSQAQQGALSVLDRVVPTYYYRMNAAGAILNDSCCADTAQENTMMGKLIIDSVSLWAKQYKVDSFRFDIMGFTPLELMKRLQLAVNQAAGQEIYLYGEAWNFGAVADDKRFVQARQANMFGSGIGSFNDRMRDAVRGGGCCDSGDNLISQQGFISGAYLDPNAKSTQSLDDVLRLADMVRVGLSGTLRDYRFTDRTGAVRSNAEIDYFGQKAGFAASPSETINYIEAHDNQTLFDVNAFRLPQSTSLADRVRVQSMGAAINVLAQGVPFFHAGQEILRSKSLDRDSYNSGDWFNRLDYSYTSNGFGVGLPLAAVNQGTWPLMAPILANPLIAPDNRAILAAKSQFSDLLAIRMDSTLFRLRTAQDVIDRLSFYNTGPKQLPGLIVMSLAGDAPSVYAGAQYKSVVVVFNVDKVAKSIAVSELKGRSLVLHRIQQNGADDIVKASTYDNATGTFSVPARTTAVFVQQ
jgi:pullulanase